MQDILHDIRQYSHHLTISQVVTFFDRKGLIITRSMIQNYVRDGLLPPPVNKRHYTHKHLATLALIVKLKTVYEMPHIKALLQPLMDNEGLPLEIYHQCIQGTEGFRFQQDLQQGFEHMDTLVLMAHSIDLKDEVIRRLQTGAYT